MPAEFSLALTPVPGGFTSAPTPAPAADTPAAASMPAADTPAPMPMSVAFLKYQTSRASLAKIVPNLEISAFQTVCEQL